MIGWQKEKDFTEIPPTKPGGSPRERIKRDKWRLWQKGERSELVSKSIAEHLKIDREWLDEGIGSAGLQEVDDSLTELRRQLQQAAVGWMLAQAIAFLVKGSGDLLPRHIAPILGLPENAVEVRVDFNWKFRITDDPTAPAFNWNGNIDLAKQAMHMLDSNEHVLNALQDALRMVDIFASIAPHRVREQDLSQIYPKACATARLHLLEARMLPVRKIGVTYYGMAEPGNQIRQTLDKIRRSMLQREG